MYVRRVSRSDHQVRRGALASVAAVAFLLGACTSEEVGAPSRPGVPPERIGATGARCPDDHPIATLSGLAYPPGHPDDPVIAPSPDRCFRSLEEANRAGYPTAEPPEGSQLIGDIYLVPTGDDLRADCLRAANETHISVACPLMLPSGGSLIPSVLLGSPVFEGGFPLPPGHDPDAASHLYVISTRPELARTLESCSLVLGRMTTTIHGRSATFIACDEAPERHGGHVIVVWKEEGASYAVSLHGVTPGNRHLVRAIAESVELIPYS
jgi:hypothetical protein